MRGEPVGADGIVPLAVMFDDFKVHRPFRTAAAYQRAADAGDLLELPHCGQIWAEDFELEAPDGLEHLNALLRSKLVVRFAGRSEALVIDFAPKANAGAQPPYQLALADEGHRFCPLTLTFPELVERFARFGGTGWYYAYLTPDALRAMNIDPRPTVAEDLAPFRDAFPAKLTEAASR